MYNKIFNNKELIIMNSKYSNQMNTIKLNTLNRVNNKFKIKLETSQK